MSPRSPRTGSAPGHADLVGRGVGARERADLDAVGHEAADEPPADEARAAGHERAVHSATLPSRSVPSPLRRLPLALLAYAQAGYPLLLAAWATAERAPSLAEPPAPAAGSLPSLTLIIAAHDEEAVIAGKVANALALDYPGLEVVVACDGCTDATAERAREAGADLVLDLPRGGKVRAQDAAVERATPTLVAFSDANATLEPDALRELVAPFADDRGRLRLRPGHVRQRGGDEPGGALLALRDGAALARVAPGLGDRRQRRDLRDPPRRLPRRRPDHGPRPLVPLQPRPPRLALRLPPERAGDGEDGPVDRGRVGSASGG